MGILDVFKNKKTKKKKERKYDGAARTKRTSGWTTGHGDANTEISTSISTLRSRARDLRRNNPLAHRAIEVISNNVIGKGIKTIISGPGSEQLQAQWDLWTQDTSIDYDGLLNFAGIQRMIMEAVPESGEVLIRKRFVNEEFPIQYQVLESDFLSTSGLDQVTQKGNTIIQGVEFDDKGKRFGYHLYPTHPGSKVVTTTSFITNLIPASEILHIFRPERPGQVRGVTWLAPIMIKMRDLDDFEDAQLMRQKIAALFTAFVQDINAEVECDDDNSDFGEHMEPGTIEELPSGKTVTFANPPSVENYKEFTSVVEHKIAAGIGLSYEALTQDLSEVNFSSARMGWLEMNRNFQVWREGIAVHQFINEAVKDFKDMMALKGIPVSDQTKFRHIAPKREMIDPTKEIPATVKSIRAGLSTLSEEVAALGKDPAETFEKWAEDQKTTEDLGLILNSNPKYTSDSGKLQDGSQEEVNEESNQEEVNEEENQDTED